MARASAARPSSYRGVHIKSLHSGSLCFPQTAGRCEVDWPTLYLDIARASAARPVRFRGVFTDGGCDGGLMQYWVDNLFCANHNESHCSATGANIHAIGLLLVRCFLRRFLTVSAFPHIGCTCQGLLVSGDGRHRLLLLLRA